MRKSGILMHITSLPGAYGIGSLGAPAREFVDFLTRAGQSYWQILPLSPTGYGNSPYQALSAFAGNHYIIDLDTLVLQGLLEPQEVRRLSWGKDPERVDFGLLYKNRLSLLRQAYGRFRPQADYAAFLDHSRHWLPDYALYMALKESSGGLPWLRWQEPLRLRRPEALAEARKALRDSIDFHTFLQYEFFGQWQALRDYAADRGIRIIGDIPIYVPLDSADAWANPELFQLNESRSPTAVAGCPPDAFTSDGQLWGNPLYRWDVMQKDGYRWWHRRLSSAAELCDVIRLDHFRGFESYWAVPAGEATARNGRWIPGPGQDFIDSIRKAGFSCIAEDLGYVTPEVRRLQLDSGYPGMKVMEFAFDSREAGNYLPYTYPENSVCYSGTHDNPTLKQWLEETAPQDLKAARTYLGLNREEGYVTGLIRGCMGSCSRLCVIQMQDWLELGSTARMNFPGTLSNQNWTWRAAPEALTPALAEKIRSTTERYGRL